ncbi:LuxR C-terminal-related transcriptional regulator [Planotetraspora phitsanulokensis]|uniref:HTH luxR-type domain-containing protein n=1 Tax=Planotetraspora phitsanulokensis TaxID=575192 RepID=A0A8J3U024_9ACTN|nr:LuxR C-terminal-related transcriptional regulator [Planotetraspora phitsanulokensis]GII35814.1 hypothetical protein Pph01_08170 [Planotetraspora phitsanulokensis]
MRIGRAHLFVRARAGRTRDVVWRHWVDAEGRSNAAIAAQLWLAERTVESHIASILGKLGLPVSGQDHRRVRAVVTYLNAMHAAAQPGHL